MEIAIAIYSYTYPVQFPFIKTMRKSLQFNTKAFSYETDNSVYTIPSMYD